MATKSTPKVTKPMTKAEMIANIAETVETPKTVVDAIYTAVIELVAKETKKTGVFTLPGLGKFSIGDRKARTGRNPHTGEAIKIKAKKVLKFSVSKLIKDKVVPAK